MRSAWEELLGYALRWVYFFAIGLELNNAYDDRKYQVQEAKGEKLL